jgi:hypothetical protein
MHVFSSGRDGSIIEVVDAFIAALRSSTNKSSYQTHTDTHANRHEVEIMYSGHTNESLKMTFERLAIPDGRYTLGQLLCSLYKRGDQWVDELDDDNLVCTVNGREARLFDTIEAGAEIRISS